MLQRCRHLYALLFALCLVFVTGGVSAEPARELPTGTQALEVAGFNPAAFVAPRGSKKGPWPLTVVLHGNYDRPEWQCDSWSKTARSRGWLLCPRGYPRKDAPVEADRWTYAGRHRLAQEIEAGVSALERRFPGKVRRDDAWLIGFSLGANITPRLLLKRVLPFKRVVLAEGGFGVTVPLARSAAAAGVERVVYLCGERTYCPRRSRSLVKVWRQGRVRSVERVIMPDTGHGYSEDFEPIAARVFELLSQ